MRNKRFRLLLIPLVIVLIIIIINLINSNISGISGDEWITKSHKYIDTTNSFIDNFDNTLTLYLSGVTNAESFSMDYELLKKQWLLLEADYEKFKEENPVLPDTATSLSGICLDSADLYYKEINSLFNEMDKADKTNSKHLSYIYLAHQQSLVKHYTSYILAYNISTGIYDGKNIESTSSTE